MIVPTRIFSIGAFLVFVAGLILLLYKGLHLNPNQHSSPLIGKKAPEFEVHYVLGGPVELQQKFADTGRLSLKDFTGSVVLLNVWASWCTSCAEEAQELEQIWQRHQKAGLIVIGVASHDTLEDAKAFASKIGKTYAIGLDTKDTLTLDYGVTGVPETFLIDRKGLIRFKEDGPVDEKLLSQDIQTLLTES